MRERKAKVSPLWVNCEREERCTLDLGGVAVDVAGMRARRGLMIATTRKYLFVWSSLFIRRVQVIYDCSTTPTPTTAFWVAFIPTMNQLDSFLL